MKKKNLLLQFVLTAVLLSMSIFVHAQTDGTVQVTAPASVAGDYAGFQAGFGPGITMDVTGPVVEAVDTAGLTTVCDTVANDLSGSIALLDRGGCAFTDKVLNAQTKGAIAVIVCNNDMDSPYKAQGMGGTSADVLIPSIMIPYNQCQTIRAELGNGLTATITANTIVPPGPGEGCETATVVSAGTHTIDAIDSGLNAILANAGNAVWYSYTPAANTLVTVTSCALTDVDSRLFVFTGPDCDPANLTIVADNDDCVDGVTFSSETSFLGFGGTTYLIYWDDRWQDEGFDFEIVESALPMANVVFTVDMTNETVATPLIAGSFNGWTEDMLTDNGDGTWSGTYSIMAGESVQYKFLNGTGNWEDDSELGPCGVDDGFGGFNRVYSVSLDDPQELDADCFTVCGNCPSDVPTDCADPTIFFGDDIESYALGDATGQAPHWSLWPGATIGGDVSEDFASSGTKSIKIDGNTAGQDALLLLDDKITGNYLVRFDLYIPDGSSAYFNMQHEAPTTTAGFWGLDVFFDAGGTGEADHYDGGDPAPLTFPHDEWFEVYYFADIDANESRLIVGEVTVAAWAFENAAGTPTLQLNSLNFFPIDAGYLYYIDNVDYWQIPEADDGHYCYTAVAAVDGTNTVPELECFGGGYDLGGGDGADKAYWFTYTPATDGILSISSCNAGPDTRGWIFTGECHELGTVGINDDQCDQGNGDLYASYREAVVTGGEQYFIMWDNAWETTGFDFELALSTDPLTDGNYCQSAIVVGVGTHSTSEIDGHAAVAGPVIGTTNDNATPTAYVQSEWFSFTPDVDGIAIISSCATTDADTRVFVYTGDCTTFEDLTLVGANDDGDNCPDFQSELALDVTAGTTYLIEWVDTWENTAFDWTITMNAPVTFAVDMSMETVAPDGVLLVGDFVPGTAIEMSDDDLDMVYEVTIPVAHNTSGTFLYSNGFGNSEVVMEQVDLCLADNDQRMLDVGTDAVVLDVVCYNYCVACDMIIAVDEVALEEGVRIYPNPASDLLNLEVDFAEVAENLQVNLVDVLGATVLSRQFGDIQSGNLSINVADISTGVYNLEITSGTARVTKRLIIE